MCAGLMLVLLYGREGWFAPIIRASGYNIVFAFPGTQTPPAPALHDRSRWPGCKLFSLFDVSMEMTSCVIIQAGSL